MAGTERSVGLAEAKNHLSALTNEANETGEAFIIFKNKRPWAEVKPLGHQATRSDGSISITPVRRQIEVPDLEELFANYDSVFQPAEDGFAAPQGNEVL